MAEKVPILVSCSFSEKHSKKRMDVLPNIALADLIKEVETEFACSQQIELRKMIDDDNWVVLKDPLDLRGKPKLRAEKVCSAVYTYIVYVVCKKSGQKSL